MYSELESLDQESTEMGLSHFIDQESEHDLFSLSDRLLEFQQHNLMLQDETGSEEIYASTVSNDDLLLQIQVTNNLLSIGIALLFFIFVFMVIQFFIEVIKNNITNFFD